MVLNLPYGVSFPSVDLIVNIHCKFLKNGIVATLQAALGNFRLFRSVFLPRDSFRYKEVLAT